LKGLTVINMRQWVVFLLLLAGLSNAAAPKPAFVAAGKEFHFDTGSLRGTLRAQGKSQGLGPVVDIRSGVNVAHSLGLLSPYRLLDAGTRYLPDARDQASDARLLTDGAVEVTWAEDAKHPFELRLVYRWASSNALDVTTTLVAGKELHKFEVFLASYFAGFPSVFGYGKEGFVEVTKAMGDWLAFPRDEAATALIADGRWQRPPHPVTFKPVIPYAGALGMRRDAKSGLAALVMSPPGDCFAVLMPYGEENHRSLYLSLFGRDFKPGETATARARLVVGRGITDAQAVEIYRTYLKELKP
jgi:hypothetical protein